MALFNFTFTNPAGNNNNQNADITLQLNEEVVTVPAAQARGLTVGQVFAQFGSRLGDLTRVNRFVATNGRLVDAGDTVEPGTVYRATVQTESKG